MAHPTIEKTITIKPKSAKRALQGHPWIFSNEIHHIKPRPEPGILVKVLDEHNRFFGYGTYNPHSLITVRLLSRRESHVPGSLEWFQQKISQAYQLRNRLYPNRQSYRLIYSDSDGLPGLIVDRYSDILSVQILTAGMEQLKETIIDALVATINPKGIVFRNDNDIRNLEELPLYVDVVYGEVDDEVMIDEAGLKLQIHPKGGQKTGYFFDQVENRQALAQLIQGGEVADVFCYNGGWAMHMLQAGADHAVLVDQSKPALKQAQINAELNGFADKTELIASNAFNWFTAMRQDGQQFDCLVVDPPAFAKSPKQIKNALRGYEDINRQAIHLVKNGGVFCSCSCSQPIQENDFLLMLQRAAARERKNLQILEIRGQGKDHPIHIHMPESRYLKCVIGIILT